MKPERLLLGTLLLTLSLALGSGCRSRSGSVHPRSSGYSASFLDAPPAGSIGDLNRKLDGRGGGAGPAGANPERPGDLVLLVMHDAEGRPVYVETRLSSGDPALDQRAQDYVLKHRRFPRGQANTVLLPLKRSEIPRPRGP